MNAALPVSLRVGLAAAAGLLLLSACAGGQGPSWTFAPLGPTQPAAGSPAASPGGSPAASPVGSPAASPGGSPGASPAASPGGALELVTPADQPLAFVPNQLSAAPATEVTVNYLNDSNLPHNVHFFEGPDPAAGTLASTEIETGPGNEQSVSFTTPEQPGDYFFHCDVHPQQMTGTLVVGP